MYLIVGANGYLGSYILKNVLNMTDAHVIATARHTFGQKSQDERVSWYRLDISNFSDVDKLAASLSQDFLSLNIIYLAAYHHPDEVENHPNLAWDINVTALSHFLNAFRGVRCFVYPSTDTVYGESFHNECFSEDAELNPINRYGRQKVMAEELVTAFDQHICRYPFLIAPSLVQNKKHFYDVITDTIRSGKTMEMFSDSFRSSLDFDTVANLTVRLIQKGDFPNIINVSGDDKLSKYDIGLMIARKIHVSDKMILPVSIKQNNNIFKVPRAASTIRDNSLLKKTLGLKEVKIHI